MNTGFPDVNPHLPWRKPLKYRTNPANNCLLIETNRNIEKGVIYIES